MAFLTIGALLFCGIIVTLVLYNVRRKRLYELASKFPGPPTVPLLGNALQFHGSTEYILSQTTKFTKLYSSPYRIWLGPKLLIYVSQPDQIKRVLYSDKTIDKSDLYRFFRPWLGNGLFSAPAGIWRVHRKLIGPTFNLKILESFVEVFSTQAKILVERMASEIDGPEFEIFNYVSLCAMDIICESAMGLSIGAQTSKDNQRYIDAMNRAFSTVYERMFIIWLHPDFIFWRSKIGREQKECVEILHRLTDDVIRTKTEALKKHKSVETCGIELQDEISEPQPRRKTYLDLLMELTHDEMKFSESELREEVDTMMLAGNDTTSTITTYVMLMLASFQNVQDKVYEELCEIYGSDVDDLDNRNVTHEDLPRMEYMERVMKESMRLFPIASAIGREVREDLTMGEHILPKGCIVAVNVLGLHRSEKYWQNPLEFDPDRFLPEEIAKRNPYCFIPFSAGPRNCIGLRFAMMEMKTIIATVLRRYIIKKDDPLPIREIRLKSAGFLKPVDPIKLRIIQRRK